MSYYDNYGADIFADETLALTKRGKPRKRKPKEPRIYFTQDTEDAIVEYLASNDQIERNRIYNERIEYAFYKLAENIIHTFKFYYTDFLLSKIHLYDQTKGTKAYSYFGTIAKRYLILSNQKNYKKRIDTTSIDILEEDENHSYDIEDSPYNERLSMYIDEFTDYWLK